MSKVTKTIGQLHFEDLEPRRFEDLVRQLAYDFRNWNDLEDTGKSGSDEGFDIRGKEIVSDETEPEAAEEGEEAVEPKTNERIWLIQCKREKSMGPTKLKKYVKEIVDKHKGKLYGLIFVAPCHFSKKARDGFYETIAGSGIQEAYIWDRSKLEDMLFQPKNDHLLFAYFGISLSMRHRSAKTKIRKKLVPKRKLIKLLGDIKREHFGKPVLIRNVEAEDYPYSGDLKDFDKNPQWKLFQFKKHHHRGIVLLKGRYYAYLADDGEGWDYVKGINEGRPHHDPWEDEETEAYKEKKNRAWHFWSNIPEKNRGWLEVTSLLPYDCIVEIDEHGDNVASDYEDVPHLYVNFVGNKMPLHGSAVKIETMSPFNRRLYDPDVKKRVEYFPKKFPKPKPKAPPEPTDKA